MAFNGGAPMWQSFTSNSTVAITPSVVWSDQPLYINAPMTVNVGVAPPPRALTEIERLRADVDEVCALGRAA